MDWNLIITFISGVGFPIFACCILWKKEERLIDTLAEMSKTLVLLTERVNNIENYIKREEIKKDGNV